MSVANTDLLRDLESTELDRRIAAARKLAQAVPPDSSAVVPLIRVLNGAFDEELFGWVETALEAVEPRPEQTPVLVEFVRQYLGGTTKPEVAYWSATMLGKSRAATEDVLKTLAELLGHAGQPNVQARAAWALGEIGPPARSVLPQLRLAAASTLSPKLIAFARLRNRTNRVAADSILDV